MREKEGITVGIDATRSRSGGGLTHIIGLLSAGHPGEFGIKLVHLWGFQELIESIPQLPWLVKHCPKSCKKSMVHQLWWQAFALKQQAREAGCEVMLNTDAGSVCRFSPCVTMSRDMLSFEPGEMQRYKWSRARLRLLLLWYVQAQSLRRADRAVFLTRYAADVIQKQIGQLHEPVVINHGLDSVFTQRSSSNSWPSDSGRDVRVLYVSNAALHKHQWQVVAAFKRLYEEGLTFLTLDLVGGGKGPAQQMLEESIEAARGVRVRQIPFVKHQNIPSLLQEADIFVFASSCENMPNTLIEAMASGLPIACSDRGPMPEVLGNGGVYFDPENPTSIAEAVKKIVKDPKLRLEIAGIATQRASHYTWDRCARETWTCLAKVANPTK